MSLLKYLVKKLPADTATAQPSALPCAQPTAKPSALPGAQPSPDPENSPPACIFRNEKCVTHDKNLELKIYRNESFGSSARPVYTVEKVLTCPTVFNLRKITKPLELTSGENQHSAQNLQIRRKRIRKCS